MQRELKYAIHTIMNMMNGGERGREWKKYEKCDRADINILVRHAENCIFDGAEFAFNCTPSVLERRRYPSEIGNPIRYRDFCHALVVALPGD